MPNSAAPARAYMERLLPLTRESRYDLGALISHRMTLSEGPRGYDLYDRKLLVQVGEDPTR